VLPQRSLFYHPCMSSSILAEEPPVSTPALSLSAVGHNCAHHLPHKGCTGQDTALARGGWAASSHQMQFAVSFVTKGRLTQLLERGLGPHWGCRSTADPWGLALELRGCWLGQGAMLALNSAPKVILSSRETQGQSGSLNELRGRQTGSPQGVRVGCPHQSPTSPSYFSGLLRYCDPSGVGHRDHKAVCHLGLTDTHLVCWLGQMQSHHRPWSTLKWQAAVQWAPGAVWTG
jgi:hypothetical protein